MKPIEAIPTPEGNPELYTSPDCHDRGVICRTNPDSIVIARPCSGCTAGTAINRQWLKDQNNPRYSQRFATPEDRHRAQNKRTKGFKQASE